MEQQQNVASARRIYRRKSVLERLDNPSVSTLYAWMADPKVGFPKPIKLANGHSVAWDARQVDEWIERQFTKAQPQGGQA